jgi:uncharacterized protein YbjQ (UPF0145 family)
MADSIWCTAQIVGSAARLGKHLDLTKAEIPVFHATDSIYLSDVIQICYTCAHILIRRRHAMNTALITTAFELPGYQLRQNLGVVTGIATRSSAVIGNLAAAFHSVLHGNSRVYTRLCEDSREAAQALMVQQASRRGANAIIGVRFASSALWGGFSEIVCYGTAVIAVPLTHQA